MLGVLEVEFRAEGTTERDQFECRTKVLTLSELGLTSWDLNYNVIILKLQNWIRQNFTSVFKSSWGFLV